MATISNPRFISIVDGIIGNSIFVALGLVPAVVSRYLWGYGIQDEFVGWIIISFMVIWSVFSCSLLVLYGYLFRGRLVIARSAWTGLSIFCIMFFISFTPIVVYRGIQNEFDSQRGESFIRVYKLASDALVRISRKSKLDENDLNDVIKSCYESLSYNQALPSNFRVTVVFHNSGFLVMPSSGYYGSGFDSDVNKMVFDVRPRRVSETQLQYLERLGVAGWTFVNERQVSDFDIQNSKEKEYAYKKFPASEKDRADRGILTIPIFDNSAPNKRVVGVLTVSTPQPFTFKESDIRIAQFFANILFVFYARKITG